jgi:uncharacterized protein (TIGR00270 family)
MRPTCDLCGSTEVRYKARVAGTEAMVCGNCAAHGEILDELKEPPKKAEMRRIEEKKKEIVHKTEEVIENIGELVKHKREELGLKQDDLGKLASENDSMIKRIEHGYLPTLEIAHKLERALHIKLTEVVNPSEQEVLSNRSGGALTLGDIMVVRKQKK